MTEPTIAETPLPRELPIAQTGRRAVRARTILETVAVIAAAGLTMTSAISAKRAGMGPAMVALEPAVQAAPTPVATVAAAVETPAPLVEAPAAAPAPATDPSIITPPEGHVRYFNGRPIRPARTIWMTVTAYSPDHRSCGDSADGYTSTNHSVWTNAMNLVAADPKVLPMRSMISVPGYADGNVVPVLDVGGAIKGARLDVLYPTHSIARKWGVQRLQVTVWEYADEPAKSAKKSKRK